MTTDADKENERLRIDLRHAEAQQAATSEILRVLADSPGDPYPVFDAIVRHAAHLCGATWSGVSLTDGQQLTVHAAHGLEPAEREAFLARFPIPLARDTASGRAILERRVIHVDDQAADPAYAGNPGQLVGTRTIVAVPMLRGQHAIGAVGAWRRDVRPFSDRHIALLQTFASHAVLAIENARLFKNTKDALEQQRATSEILRATATSTTSVQPVFDAIAKNARALLNGHTVSVSELVGNELLLMAYDTTNPVADGLLRASYPMRVDQVPLAARVMRERTAAIVTDITIEPEVTEQMREVGRARGFRSFVWVPMLRDETVIGIIAVTRTAPGAFTDADVTLLKIFADQAVIAIQNVRLFKTLEARTADLTRSVEQLTALGEVGRAVSSTLDLETVLTTIVARAVELSRSDGGVVFEYDQAEEAFVQRAATGHQALAEARRTTVVRKGEGVVGRTAMTLKPAQVPDITVPGAYESPLRDNVMQSGIRAILAVPMVRDERLIGNLVVSRNRPGEFSSETIELLRTFATQSALAIQNARLFRQLEIKSRELEVASQHKSEFLASMSHELRTPLNAIIGFSDVLLQGMFGETNEKQTEYLRDILSSGQHLLSLINDILDLSKIEAGRMELDAAPFHLSAAVEDALLLMRERAERRSIALERHVHPNVGEITADQRKVKQVLLNLLSNAIKFTPEGGKVQVEAALVDGAVTISVADTGVGIAAEHHEAVFEEFRQVGTADSKAQGTGLGLALCRKFVELHGGRIWVESTLAAGSTFRFTLPMKGS